MKTFLIVNLIALAVLAIFLTVLLINYVKTNKALFHTTSELAIVKNENNKLESQLNAYKKPNLVNIYPETYNIVAAWCKEAGI